LTSGGTASWVSEESAASSGMVSHVIASNEGKSFQRDIKVITGVDGEVEVLAR
jgi:hypothetical protein